MMDDHIEVVMEDGVMHGDNVEEHEDVENMEVVMEDEDNVDYIIEVVMDEDNVEIVDVDNMEVQMDDEVLPADVEIVDVLPGELEFMDIFEDFNPEVAVELPRVHAPRVDRPASVRHPLSTVNAL
ncbi:unnamed protein product [Macrosiphum euphorbiae]|uniref:Uncharacterized protein n=1 Tax=Macrosiphum euphorbiae TaxID=13131 RepID=A0AAV0Y8S8_9HEMI|nr:unnamed protein product [Macrosiphum euphorbiae]